MSIRYPKAFSTIHLGEQDTAIEYGKSQVLHEDTIHQDDQFDTVIISTGTLSWPAYDAAQELNKEHGLKTAVIHLRFIKPLDTDCLEKYCKKTKSVLVLEEGQSIGGVFTYILQQFQSRFPTLNYHGNGIPDQFTDHGSIGRLLAEHNLDTAGIVETVKQLQQNPIPC